MEPLVRSVPLKKNGKVELEHLIEKEWLVTNGLGGYACGTLVGAATRRYHGMLIAAHPKPLGRVMMLNHLFETFRFPDWSSVAVGGAEKADRTLDIQGADLLAEFRMELGLPVWRYESRNHVIERRIFMPHNRNTVYIVYQLMHGSGPVRLKLRPSVHFRGHDDPVSAKQEKPYCLQAVNGRYEVCIGDEFPKLRLRIDGKETALTLDGVMRSDVLYRVEESRGYEGVGMQWSPGFFRADLKPGEDVVLTASSEPWDQLLAISPREAHDAELARRRRLISAAAPSCRTGFGAELVLAADQFVILPASRSEDTTRAHASGDEARTVIAGYHWFTDWGRDTMISLEGLTLTTGRHAEAGYILRTFGKHVKDGLIPNFFTEGESVAVYHTADATMWFFHALSRYIAATGDRSTMLSLLPTLRDIFDWHMKGTHYGIRVDPKDGLLTQGAEGYQLTWMDAKVGDWVVTPRRGKAVEINALWYNALRLLEEWLREEKSFAKADEVKAAAERTFRSFNERFWCEKEKGLYDVLDGEAGNDPACRPNQIFSISLPNPILDPSRWKQVVETVRTRLLTPVGLRSLAPGHADYKARYFGNLRSRDAAYHQGTVWGWLIGPYFDAWKKTHVDKPGTAHQLLQGFADHLSEACMGSISEIFDAEDPYTPRGCVAQAWSVAEVLRCWAQSD